MGEDAVERITNEITETVAECMDVQAMASAHAANELRWANRAIAMIRLGFMSATTEFPLVDKFVEDPTTAEVNRAMRAAARYLTKAFEAAKDDIESYEPTDDEGD